MKSYFLVNANGEIGLGHWKRSLELSTIFIKRGHEVEFITLCSDTNLLKEATDRNIKITLINEYNKYPNKLEGVFHAGDLVIIDDDHHSLKTPKFQASLREKNLKFGYFSVDTETPFDCDFVISYNITSSELPYKVSPRVKRLTHTDFIIFREEFDRKTEKSSSERNNILIAFGGTDPKNLTVQVALKLNLYLQHFDKCFVIQGPLSKLPPEFENVDKDKFGIIRNSSNIAEVMNTCKVGFCGAGGTFYEMALLGVPCWVAASSTRETLAQQEITARKIGFGLEVDKHNTITDSLENQLKKSLTSPLDQLPSFTSFSESLDTQGKFRIVNHLLHD